MTDYAQRRTMMVDTQIRPSDVTKFNIIDAMLSVPREAFVPQSLREAAYLGENLGLGGGRVVMDPRTLAKMLDAIDIQPDELVLDIGCTYGYSAAVMARLAEAVIAVECDGVMAKDAETALSENGSDNAVVLEAALEAGAPQHGPYDVIVIQGGVDSVPQAIVDQLKDGGRIGALHMTGALGRCQIGLKERGQITWRFAFNAAAPVLPGYSQEAAFQF